MVLQRVLNVQLCMAWSYLLLEIYQKPCAHITHQYFHHTHMVLVTIGNYRAFTQNPECMNRGMVRKYSRRVFIKWKGAKKAQSLVHTRLRTFFVPFANICLYFDMALAQRFEGCFGDLLYSGILIDLKYVGHTNKTKGHWPYYMNPLLVEHMMVHKVQCAWYSATEKGISIFFCCAKERFWKNQNLFKIIKMRTLLNVQIFQIFQVIK